ncbi:MAG: outer membrane beta-barrel protein [candidate division Zixibacteria bacterium]|nr:outer membrane beta-barrel protein [candidate division Zixibacteria bacterium]
MTQLWSTVLILGLLAGTAVAQTEMGVNLYGGGGVSFPSSDLSDVGKTGYHGLVGVGFSPVPSIETAARFAYNSFAVKDGGDDKFTVSEYGLDIRANLAAPVFNVRPYALIGGGFAKYDFPSSLPVEMLDGVLAGIKPETEFFYCIGGGIKVNAMPRVDFFLEARYTKLSASDRNLDYLPVSVGLSLAL